MPIVVTPPITARIAPIVLVREIPDGRRLSPTRRSTWKLATGVEAR